MSEGLFEKYILFFKQALYGNSMTMEDTEWLND